MLCLFRQVTGRPCPSCGLTRSWQAIGHGRIGDGLAAHPFGPLTVLAAVWLASDASLGDASRPQTADGARSLQRAWIGAWLWRLSRAT